MDLPVNLTELRRRTQENLVAFLHSEVDLATTMLGIMKTTNDEDRRQRLADSIQTAVNTILYFEQRVENAAVRRELLAATVELEKAISSWR